MGYKEHKEQSPASVNCYAITVSDTRTEETDESGKIIKEYITTSGHNLTGCKICHDDYEDIVNAVTEVLADTVTNVIIINGGTGIAKRDVTIEAVKSLIEKELVGFGEIFRHLSYMDIGSPAIMSRAIAGVSRNKIIIAVPGSKGAVKLAMDKLILPEMAHMVREITK